MDKQASELSKAGLQLAKKEMSPEYQRVQARLLGYLAAHDSTVEQLALREQNASANQSLLNQFAKLLPKAELANARWTLWLDDPYILRIMQSVTVWSDEVAGFRRVSYDDGKTYHTYPRYARRPYLILGKKGENYNQLLVACIGSDENTEHSAYDEIELGEDDDGELVKVLRKYGELYLFKPGRKDRKRIGEMDRILASEYPSPADMAMLFNNDQHLLEVNADSTGSTKLRRKIDRWDNNDNLDRVFDEQIAEFDVISHLNRIAVGLSLEDKLADLISQHSITGDA